MRRWGLILVGIMLLAACGNSTGDKVNDASNGTATSAVVGDIASSTSVIAAVTPSPTVIPPTETPSPTPSPTSTPTPAPTPTPSLQALTLGAKGFGTSKFGTGYGFIVTNPNAGVAITDSQFQVAIYDANNTVLKTDSGYIPIIFAGEQIGVSGQMFLSEGQTPDHIDVQIKSGKADASVQATTDFAAENVTYVADQYLPKVTGVVKSPFTKDFDNVRVSVIAYDGNGAIIGGGFSYIDFVPAGGQAAAEVSLSASAAPAKVEMYATLSNLSLLGK